jgi:hypothetical protein
MLFSVTLNVQRQPRHFVRTLGLGRHTLCLDSIITEPIFGVQWLFLKQSFILPRFLLPDNPQTVSLKPRLARFQAHGFARTLHLDGLPIGSVPK